MFPWLRPSPLPQCVFNDDVQGTAATAVGGLYGAMAVAGKPASGERRLCGMCSLVQFGGVFAAISMCGRRQVSPPLVSAVQSSKPLVATSCACAVAK